MRITQGLSGILLLSQTRAVWCHQATRRVDHMDAVAELEEVIRTLAAIPERGSASPGEREAAHWLAERFSDHGCDVAVEEEVAHGTYWWPMGISAGAGALAGAAGLAGLARSHSGKGRFLRCLAVLGGVASAASLVDDVTSGPRFLRKWALPKKT